MTDPVALKDLLKAGLTARPDDDAVVSLQQRWTFRELDHASTCLAAAYSRLGLEPGARIASLMPNRGILLVHYLACMKGGFVAVPFNYRFTHNEISHALEVSGADAMLHHAERGHDLEQCGATQSLAGRVVTYGGGEDAPGPHLEDLIEEDPAGFAQPDLGPDTPVVIFFTSGSTGPSKGVTHSHSSTSHLFRNIVLGFELTADDVMMPASSMSHIGGYIFSFGALSVGGRVLVARSMLPDEVLPLMRQERPTVMCMLPAALFNVVRDGHATAEDFNSLRLIRSGSDKVPGELEEEFTELTGLEIDEGWGCSEVGLATINPPYGRIVAGSIGLPIQGVDISLRDDEGNTVPDGDQGSAWVRSGSVMKGYWGDDAATDKVKQDGWLDTGDLLRADEDGYLWFRGRKKQIIVHNGLNIFPQEVEDVLLLHPGVDSAGVIGVHDLVYGENVRAYVVKKDGAAPTAQELILFVREEIGYKAPEEIVFIEEMPLNPTGKTDRPALKVLAEAHHDVVLHL